MPLIVLSKATLARAVPPDPSLVIAREHALSRLRFGDTPSETISDGYAEKGRNHGDQGGRAGLGFRREGDPPRVAFDLIDDPQHRHLFKRYGPARSQWGISRTRSQGSRDRYF